MWIITYFSNKDYKIDCENWRRYRINDDYLLEAEKYFNFERKEVFSWENIYNNEIVQFLYDFYNSNFKLEYRDINYESNEEIIFKYNTYLWNKKYYITPDFLKELHENYFKDKSNYNNFEFVLFLEDDKKNIFYKLWTINISFWYEWGWFLSSSYPVIYFNEIYKFNRFEFVDFISKKYFWIIKNDNYENFVFQNWF